MEFNEKQVPEAIATMTTNKAPILKRIKEYNKLEQCARGNEEEHLHLTHDGLSSTLRLRQVHLQTSGCLTSVHVYL